MTFCLTAIYLLASGNGQASRLQQTHVMLEYSEENALAEVLPVAREDSAVT